MHIRYYTDTHRFDRFAWYQLVQQSIIYNTLSFIYHIVKRRHITIRVRSKADCYNEIDFCCGNNYYLKMETDSSENCKRHIMIRCVKVRHSLNRCIIDFQQIKTPRLSQDLCGQLAQSDSLGYSKYNDNIRYSQEKRKLFRIYLLQLMK